MDVLSAFRKIRTTIFSPKVSLEKRITYAMVFCAMIGEIIGFIGLTRKGRLSFLLIIHKSSLTSPPLPLTFHGK